MHGYSYSTQFTAKIELETLRSESWILWRVFTYVQIRVASYWTVTCDKGVLVAATTRTEDFSVVGCDAVHLLEYMASRPIKQ